MKSFLVIQTAFIGDVILMTSLIEKIVHHHESAIIDIVVRDPHQKLLENNPHIRKVIIWNKKKKFLSLLNTIKEIRSFKYDYVLNVQRFMNSGLMTLFSKAYKKVGFDKNPLSFTFHAKVRHQLSIVPQENSLHEVERNDLLFEAATGIQSPAYPPALYFNQEITKKIDSITEKVGKYVVIAPTSVWFTKQWEKHKWRELASLCSKDFHLFFIGASSDVDQIKEIVNDLSNTSILAGKINLLESAYLMSKARRVFVNDSAPLHLASSVNARTTAIFCSTSPSFGYTPLADDSVVFSAQDELSCLPCGLHGKKACPLGHFKCSSLISAKEVFQSI